jgi:alpha-L-fucosidase
MLRTAFLLLAVALLSACTSSTPPPAPLAPVPSEAQLKWHEMEFYMFVHFNMNTFSNMEWGTGAESPQQFNPSALDTRQWARIAKAAGMKGIILTAKHHDGFCLWPTTTTEHSVKNSPWKNGQGDVLRELASACEEYGLKMGVYLSPWDRNHEDYGGTDYIDDFRNQLRELLTQYGDIFEVWFDGANGGTGYYGGANEERKVDRKTYYNWPQTYQIIDTLMPNAIIFSDAGPGCRWVGNEEGWANETNWSMLRTADVYPGMPDYEQLRSGHEDGTDWVPAECDVSIRPGWYYHPYEDHKVKPLSRLVDIYYHSVGRNGSLLLNMPVDQRGLIHEADSAALMQLAGVIRDDFAQDLARGKTITANHSRGGSAEFGPEKTIDGNPESYWAADDSVLRAVLTVDFGEPTEFNRLVLQEYIRLGQRVRAFSVEAEVDGNWKTLARQTTIGYKRILRFPTVKASKLRLNLLDARACPTLSKLEVYRAPELLVEPSISRDKKGLVNLTVPNEALAIYYTLDGSVPTSSSQRYEGEFMLREPAEVRAMSYDPESNRSSQLASKRFDISKGDWKILKVNAGSLTEAGRMIDGDPDNWWGTPEGSSLPVEIVLDLGRNYALKGLTYLPMQERWISGFITRYEIYVSNNRIIWGKAVAVGEFANIQNNPIEQLVSFGEKTGRFVKLVATGSIDGTVGIAELGVRTE